MNLKVILNLYFIVLHLIWQVKQQNTSANSKDTIANKQTLRILTTCVKTLFAIQY